MTARIVFPRILRRALALSVLLAASLAMRAECKGAPRISAERAASLRKLVGAEDSFHVYSETAAGDLRFFAYSVGRPSGSSGAPLVYFAALRKKAGSEEILFVHDVNLYLPEFAGGRHTAPPRPSNAPKPPSPWPVTVDACINSFELEPKVQAIHLNLYAKSKGAKVDGANDIIFVMPENGFVQPALEMNETSRINTNPRQNSKRDSLIAVVPATGAKNEVIWKESSRQESGPVAGSSVEVSVYAWEGKGFRKNGSLAPDELNAQLKNATVLKRSGEIVPFQLKYKMPGPNAPAP
jgi:hypothetical protein